ALRSVAFPKLDESQTVQLGRCSEAKLERYPAGSVLFRVGDRDFKFFVIQSGEIEIVDESGEKPRTVTLHVAGEFTGDVAHLTGSASVVTAVARTDCELYEMSGEAVRQMINQCPDLGDVILQAFIGSGPAGLAAAVFVRTGSALAGSPRWTARRPPFLLETSCPGVF